MVMPASTTCLGGCGTWVLVVGGVGCARCWVLKFPAVLCMLFWCVECWGFVVVLVLLGVHLMVGVWFGWGCCLRIV